MDYHASLISLSYRTFYFLNDLSLGWAWTSERLTRFAGYISDRVVPGRSKTTATQPMAARGWYLAGQRRRRRSPWQLEGGTWQVKDDGDAAHGS